MYLLTMSSQTQMIHMEHLAYPLEQRQRNRLIRRRLDVDVHYKKIELVNKATEEVASFLCLSVSAMMS